MLRRGSKCRDEEGQGRWKLVARSKPHELDSIVAELLSLTLRAHPPKSLGNSTDSFRQREEGMQSGKSEVKRAGERRG